MTDNLKTPKPSTRAAEALGWIAEPFNEVVPPIHLATTYERGADGSYPGGKAYARDESPSYDQAEALLMSLERGKAALLFSSGLAAAVSVFLSLKPGDRVLVPQMMYWGLRKWLLGPATEWGLRVAFYENGNLEGLEAILKGKTARLVWIETPANPTWEIQDIVATTDLAHRYGATAVVDSTVATPVLTQPITLGADVVMHSATKYLNGHSDVVAGALVTANLDEFWERIRNTRHLGGAILGPFEAWLLLRGMRTLFLRVPTACETAKEIAERFSNDKRLIDVLYPGLIRHPNHQIAARQMKGGFGAMLSFRVRGGESAARKFASGLKFFKQATSLGSVESLVEHRASIEDANSPCPPDLVRLSIGIEDVNDLVSDIDRTLSDLH